MKKIMYMAVAAIAALSSCSSEDIAGSNTLGGEANVFTATIENDEVTSRSTYNSSTRQAEWVASTDKINVGGAEYTADQSGATTTFTGTGATKEGEVYKAYYPSTMVSGTTISLPAAYTYSETSSFNMPMYAQSATTALSFQNICGVLAIKVKSATVSSITVTSDKPISGTCTISGDGSTTKYYAVASGTAETDKKVTLNFESAVTTTSDGTIFYLPVPAGNHWLTIAISDGTNTKYMVTKSAVSVASNKIYSFDFTETTGKGEAEVSSSAGISGNKVQWVQLWAGGPKFATINVGQTVTDYSTITTATYSLANVGGLYTWGGTANSNGDNYSDDHKTGTAVLDGDNDTATKHWGSNWRMPTQAELNKLRNYNDDGTLALSTAVTTWTWCDASTPYVSGCTLKGYKVSGVGAYASNSVFFPATGLYDTDDSRVNLQGYVGNYWSSTPDGSVYAYSLFFSSSSQNVSYSSRTTGYSVRAVLKE